MTKEKERAERIELEERMAQSTVDSSGKRSAPKQSLPWSTPPKQRPVQRILIIYNPVSGLKKSAKMTQRLEALLSADGKDVETLPTEYAWHAADMMERFDLKQGDVITVVGGDGTLSEVITGLMRREDRAVEWVTIALVPGGTGNNMARDIGIADVESAAAAIKHGLAVPFDLAEATYAKGIPESADFDVREKITTYVACLLAFGLGVDANITAEKLRLLGPLRYDISSLIAILRNKKNPTKIWIDDEEINMNVAIILGLNNKTAGHGFMFAPFSQVDDGKMDILILPQHGRRATLELFNKVKAGGKHLYDESVLYLRANKTIRIETPHPEALNFDGNNIGSTPLEMRILPKAAHMFINPILDSKLIPEGSKDQAAS